MCHWRRTVSGLALMAALAGWAAERPNILWLVSEDTTTMLGCYGDAFARTPTLDKLAREGVLFERCFAQPVCAPSRFALITGMPSITCGPAGHMRGTGKIPGFVKGFPAYLRKAGYYTCNNSKTDYNSPINIGETWDRSGAQAHYKNRSQPSQPFFSVFNHVVTHESSLFPEKDVEVEFERSDPAKVRLPPYLPDTPEIRADIARNYDHIAIMDGQVAAKLAELEAAGLADNTIVFYYGDNGGVFPRSKRFLHRTGTHVPLIVRFPPRWQHLAPAPAGSRVRQLVSFMDFAPTVLSLAGASIPEQMAGRPFAGPRIGTNDFVFCTRDRIDERYDTVRSVVDARWLYIRNFRPDLPYVQHKQYMFRARGYQSWERMADQGGLSPATKQFWGPKPAEELYDLDADPDNINNLAANPQRREQIQRMRAALEKRVVETVDNGFMPEGSAHEGYDASRAPGAFPIRKAFEMACAASDRNPAALPKLVAGLKDSAEAVRWWAAQGCAMLGTNAATAAGELTACLEDASGGVQIAAAEALVLQGKANLALPALERWLTNTVNGPFALQAANVIERCGKTALPLLASVRGVALKTPPEGQGHWTEQNIHRLLPRIIANLEGKPVKPEEAQPPAARKKQKRKKRS